MIFLWFCKQHSRVKCAWDQHIHIVMYACGDSAVIMSNEWRDLHVQRSYFACLVRHLHFSVPLWLAWRCAQHDRQCAKVIRPDDSQFMKRSRSAAHIWPISRCWAGVSAGRMPVSDTVLPGKKDSAEAASSHTHQLIEHASGWVNQEHLQ